MHGDVSHPVERSGDNRQLLLGRFEGFSVLLRSEETEVLVGSGEFVECHSGRCANCALVCNTLPNNIYFPRAVLSPEIGAVIFATEYYRTS